MTVKSSPARVAAINAGSSSIKFALFDFLSPEEFRRTSEGMIERIGLNDASLHVRAFEKADSYSLPVTALDYPAAVGVLMDFLEREAGEDRLAAAGHRVVQGGPKYSEPRLITSEVLEELRRLVPIDPEHLPGEILIAEALRGRFPDLPQFACFDTAFHHDLPTVARMLPIPRRYEAQGVRRYGFHGISYSFLLEELARLGDPAAQSGRVILLHLGNGASLAAVRDGKSVDTSMGFTPAAGVPMSTRSGDLDPGLSSYLARTERMSPEEFDRMVNFGSGLLGVSETSPDVRDLLDRESADVRAAEAIALFCYQVRKWIGAFAAALGGLDALVFSGGIGENSPTIRSRICNGLEFLGVRIEAGMNGSNEGLISGPSGRVRVRVIPTDEELMIAKTVYNLQAALPKEAGERP